MAVLGLLVVPGVSAHQLVPPADVVGAAARPSRPMSPAKLVTRRAPALGCAAAEPERACSGCGFPAAAAIVLVSD